MLAEERGRGSVVDSPELRDVAAVGRPGGHHEPSHDPAVGADRQPSPPHLHTQHTTHVLTNKPTLHIVTLHNYLFLHFACLVQPIFSSPFKSPS